jgi:hypothetical protein
MKDETEGMARGISSKDEDDFLHFYPEPNSFGLKENGTIPFYRRFI